MAGTRLEAAACNELGGHPRPSAMLLGALICSAGYIWSEITPCSAWIGPRQGSAGWISFPLANAKASMQRASGFSSLVARSNPPELLLRLSGTLLEHRGWGFAGCKVQDVPPGARGSLFPSSH